MHASGRPRRTTFSDSDDAVGDELDQPEEGDEQLDTRTAAPAPGAKTIGDLENNFKVLQGMEGPSYHGAGPSTSLESAHQAGSSDWYPQQLMGVDELGHQQPQYPTGMQLVPSSMLQTFAAPLPMHQYSMQQLPMVEANPQGASHATMQPYNPQVDHLAAFRDNVIQSIDVNQLSIPQKLTLLQLLKPNNNAGLEQPAPAQPLSRTATSGTVGHTNPFFDQRVYQAVSKFAATMVETGTFYPTAEEAYAAFVQQAASLISTVEPGTAAGQPPGLSFCSFWEHKAARQAKDYGGLQLFRQRLSDRLGQVVKGAVRTPAWRCSAWT